MLPNLESLIAILPANWTERRDPLLRDFLFSQRTLLLRRDQWAGDPVQCLQESLASANRIKDSDELSPGHRALLYASLAILSMRLEITTKGSVPKAVVDFSLRMLERALELGPPKPDEVILRVLEGSNKIPPAVVVQHCNRAQGQLALRVKLGRSEQDQVLYPLAPANGPEEDFAMERLLVARSQALLRIGRSKEALEDTEALMKRSSRARSDQVAVDNLVKLKRFQMAWDFARERKSDSECRKIVSAAASAGVVLRR